MHYTTLAKRVGNAMRLAEVVQVLVRHGFADLVRRARLHEGLPARVLRGLHLMKAATDAPETLGQRLASVLTELGPTFVKFGQILSTRPDLVSKTIADELSGLQDHVAPMPFDRIRPVAEKDLGIPIENAFDTFDTEPVASASLSQVYRARLKTGQEVAVKIQRPGIRQIIESDLGLMRRLSEWVVEHVQDLAWFDPVGTVDEFGRAIHRELDFAIERRVIERFRRNYEGDPSVFVPATYPEACGSHVLTMDWIDGARIDARSAFAARNCQPERVAQVGCETLCKQVFEHRLFHADPHPGNILITRDNRIAFLDYGMVGRLEEADASAMADLLRAVFQEDSEGCVQALLVLTAGTEPVDTDALVHEVNEYLAFEAEAIVARGEVGKAIDRFTSVLRRHRLQLAPRFSLLLKALATIETTGRQLDPQLDMVPILRPFITGIIQRRMAPNRILSDAQKNLWSLFRLGRELPHDITRLLRTLRQGKLTVQLHHEKLDYLAAVTDRASNRITVGLITGALIVGSSVLISVETAKALGLAGFVIAGVLGIALVISILRSRNY